MLGTILRDQFRLLTFRRTGPGLAEHPNGYLAFGLGMTWLAGIGRYWDNPRATLLQHAGAGSLVYVFFLSALLWLIYKPLRPQHWHFRNVLLFVSLCSLPALLYAIPVERFMTLRAAQVTNAWFLGVVAVWRVALLVVFLVRVARLGPWSVLIATLLPLALIITVLALLNLEHVVFNLMAGIRPHERSPNDLAYELVAVLAWTSFLLLPILVVGYAVLVYVAWQVRSPR